MKETSEEDARFKAYEDSSIAKYNDDVKQKIYEKGGIADTKNSSKINRHRMHYSCVSRTTELTEHVKSRER